MVGPQTPPQIYPLERPETTDRRLSLRVVLDVADVLAKHGYPDIVAEAAGMDLLNLQTALFEFIYSPVRTWGTAGDLG